MEFHAIYVYIFITHVLVERYLGFSHLFDMGNKIASSVAIEDACEVGWQVVPVCVKEYRM